MTDKKHREEQLKDLISKEESRLAGIEEQRHDSLVRLANLKAELKSLVASALDRSLDQGHPIGAVPTKSSDKVALFRSLFRGREDVFARLWVNRRTGRKGYAPACSNEWIEGVCEKPKIRCGACPNRAFVPLSDSIIIDHLLGKSVVGVYPLLQDETTWFLAVDFDKHSWVDDISAFVETCRQYNLTPAIERSRSGKGAHAWFLFDAPISARTARIMGCYLITETMARRHDLSMESYDRLFPNQDNMPEGGFGNLIALPLQGEPRKIGNSVFIDERFQPFKDQWSFLVSVQRLNIGIVEMIAEDAIHKGSVIGLPLVDSNSEVDSSPWNRPPSGTPRFSPISEPLPKQIRAVLAQKVFVEKSGVPSPLLNQIKRLAAFQNPEFYKKQNLRLSTAITPRVISCSEDFPRHVALPRGCLGDLENLLKMHGIIVESSDERSEGEALNVEFMGQLAPFQLQAVDAMLKHDTGVFVAPPGTGKTVVGVCLVAKRASNALVLVHRRPLLDQWKAQLSLFLGIDPKEIGQIGAGKNKPNGRLDVGMIQSLVKKGEVDDRVAQYGHIVIDECHHIPAVSFERVLSECKSRFILGLTATPYRRDGHHPIIRMQCGPVRYAIDARAQSIARPFRHRLLVRDTSFRAEGIDPKTGIQQLYRMIAADEQRNGLIIDDLIGVVEEGRSPLLLTERRDHLDLLAKALHGFVRHIVVLQGGLSTKKRRDAADRLASIPEGEERLVLATGRYIGEGFDDARLDTLFLAMPVSWKGTLVQYTGRLHRSYPGKSEVRIYDYLDRHVPVLVRMFERRLRGYRAMGYEPESAPPNPSQEEFWP